MRLGIALRFALPRMAEASFNGPLIGLRGLHNLGNTCFMNAVLQILLKCPPVARYFLGDNHNRFECMTRVAESLGQDGATGERRPCLACEMDLLFTQCFSGKQTPFSPHSFLHTMWSTAENFAGYEQQDAHEFLIAALSAIDAGLAQCRRAQPAVTWEAGGSWGRSVSPASALSFSSLNSGRSDLARIFTGVLRSDVTCLRCRSKSTKYEDFHDVSIDLAKRSGGNNSTPATPGGGFGNGAAGEGGGDDDESAAYHGSLAACLRAFTKSERLGLQERCWCNHCDSLQDSAKQLSFHRLPSVLCFHLKRFRHSALSKQPSTKVRQRNAPGHAASLTPVHACGRLCLANGALCDAGRGIRRVPAPLAQYAPAHRRTRLCSWRFRAAAARTVARAALRFVWSSHPPRHDAEWPLHCIRSVSGRVVPLRRRPRAPQLPAAERAHFFPSVLVLACATHDATSCRTMAGVAGSRGGGAIVQGVLALLRGQTLSGVKVVVGWASLGRSFIDEGARRDLPMSAQKTVMERGCSGLGVHCSASTDAGEGWSMDRASHRERACSRESQHCG